MCENDTSHGTEARTSRQNQQSEKKTLKQNNKRNALGSYRCLCLFKSSVSMSHAALKKHIQATEGAGISYISPSQTLLRVFKPHSAVKKNKTGKQLVWNRFVHSDKCVLNYSPAPYIKTLFKNNNKEKSFRRDL